jgi:hypothetical protein
LLNSNIEVIDLNYYRLILECSHGRYIIMLLADEYIRTTRYVLFSLEDTFKEMCEKLVKFLGQLYVCNVCEKYSTICDGEIAECSKCKKSLLMKLPDDRCSICLDPLDNDAPCFKTICSHFYHTTCFRQIKRITCNSLKCPICNNLCKLNTNYLLNKNKCDCRRCLENYDECDSECEYESD